MKTKSMAREKEDEQVGENHVEEESRRIGEGQLRRITSRWRRRGKVRVNASFRLCPLCLRLLHMSLGSNG
jgi:hypothetical protein